MPMDIRAYFSKTPESKSSKKVLENGKESSKVKKSRKRVLIDSDSDDDTEKTKSVAEGKSSSKKTKSEVCNTSKFFEVSKKDVSNIFGKGPVKRVEQPKPKKKEALKSELIDDIDWEDDFVLAETAALQEKANGSVTTSPGNSSSPSVKNTISDDSTSHESLPIKNTVSPGVLERNYSPKKHSPKKSIISPKTSTSHKKAESKEKEKVLEIVSRDHEMSPSPEREIEPVKPKLPSPKTGALAPQKNEKISTADINISPNLKKNDKKTPTINNISTTNIKKPITEKNKNVDESCKLWVEKYKPGNLKQIIGQQGEKSNMNKLVKWLKRWFSNHSGKKKTSRPSPWAKDDTGAYFKAALLSGPPGVGKTTTVHLVCQELGMDVVEFNASDTRSKKLLKEEISDLLKSKSLSSYALGEGGVSREHVLVMDEVDGMAGNEDRGGVQELIQLIKTSRVPVICMCNDRNHPKIRSLANYCFDLRFSKPRAEQIKGAMMSICFKEGLKIKPEVLNEVIVNTNQDIRLILNYLSILAAQSNTHMPAASKYVKIGPWDVARKVFSEKDHKDMSIYDKCDLFFFDYNISPLFVQENYLSVQPHSEESKTKQGKMKLFAKAANSIACGDLVEKAIRSSGAWSLLPVQAVFSSYMPGQYLVGHVGGMINFPSWLGKNSRTGKIDRMAQEIQAHTRLRASGGKEAVKLDYASVLKDRIVRPLVDHGSDGVEESLVVLKEYSLLREDLDSLSEITAWPNQPDPFSKLESKVKSAFTRAYNKNPVVTPFSIGAAVKKGRGGGGEVEENLEEGAEEEEEDEEGEEQNDITKDGMIMAVKKKASEKKEEPRKTERGGKRGTPRGKKAKN